MARTSFVIGLGFGVGATRLASRRVIDLHAGGAAPTTLLAQVDSHRRQTAVNTASAITLDLSPALCCCVELKPSGPRIQSRFRRDHQALQHATRHVRASRSHRIDLAELVRYLGSKPRGARADRSFRDRASLNFGHTVATRSTAPATANCCTRAISWIVPLRYTVRRRTSQADRIGF